MKPSHIAIIPDGNRRWAKRHKVSMLSAYHAGIDHINAVLEWCKKYGIKEVTMWGFSTENFTRSKGEVEILFRLFDKKLSDEMRLDYKKNNFRVRFLGNSSSFPVNLKKKMRQLEEETSAETSRKLNFLLGYGGRQEILDAVNSALAARVRKVDEKSFSSLLYLPGSPDLVIRTSGEMRTSGFLPWQSAYSEFYFSKKLWPDFDEKDFRRALADYSKRRRRYGK
jgi:undecaprenyl diphosphate synthase